MIANYSFSVCRKAAYCAVICSIGLLAGCFGGGDSVQASAPGSGAGGTVPTGPGETGSQRVSDVVNYLNELGTSASDSAEARLVAGIELVADDSAEPTSL
jgi:hypothetical protein